MQYDNMKTSQLVNLLAKRNLKTTGSKQKMISRLEKHDKKTLIHEYDRYISGLEEDAYALVQHMPTHEERVYCDLDVNDDPTYYKARSDKELIGKWLVRNSSWAFNWLSDSTGVCEEMFELQTTDIRSFVHGMILDRMAAIEIL